MDSGWTDAVSHRHAAWI